MKCLPACLIIFAVGLTGCRDRGGNAEPVPVAAESAALPGDIEAQVHAFCGAACHAYPPAESFPRHHWRAEVERGFRFFDKSGLALTPPKLGHVVRYYEERSPEDYPPANIAPAAQPLSVEFETRQLPAAGRRRAADDLARPGRPTLNAGPGATHAHAPGVRHASRPHPGTRSARSVPRLEGTRRRSRTRPTPKSSTSTATASSTSSSPTSAVSRRPIAAAEAWSGSAASRTARSSPSRCWTTSAAWPTCGPPISAAPASSTSSSAVFGLHDDRRNPLPGEPDDRLGEAGVRSAACSTRGTARSTSRSPT